jgi:hypothetical protein
VDGVWYNLGNSGYTDDGLEFSTKFARVTKNEYLFDFPTELSLAASYTLTIELTAKATNGSVNINSTDNVNDITDGLGTRGAVESWAGNQNFTHIIIKEVD